MSVFLQGVAQTLKHNPRCFGKDEFGFYDYYNVMTFVPSSMVLFNEIGISVDIKGLKDMEVEKLEDLVICRVMIQFHFTEILLSDASPKD